jgi:DNA primase catalytic core
MQVSKAGIERIRHANPIAAVVAERGVELKRKGKSLVGLCPFHKEKTPSFSISADKGLFKCFGCGESGDVIGFVIKHDKLGFPAALEALARRAGLDVERLMQDRPRAVPRPPADALAPPAAAPGPLLARVVDLYHRTFCEREDAQDYLKKRGLTDPDLWRVFRIGYADGSLLKTVPKTGGQRQALISLGVVTAEGRELMGGCVVVPIPDPVSGQWTNLYGRGMKAPRHCYLPGPLRGVVNFQAARMSPEVILAESVLDALSFHQAGVSTAIPIYGANGFTPDHLDLLKREGVNRVILALDNDDAGRKATDSLKEKLTAVGIAVRVATLPAGIKDPNELLASRNGDAGALLRRCLDEAEPRDDAARSAAAVSDPGPVPAPEVSSSPAPARPATAAPTDAGQLILARDALTYRVRVYPPQLGRLRATVRAESGSALHVDTLDLYASRSRSEFAKRAGKVLNVALDVVEADLLALLVDVEKATANKNESAEDAPSPAAMSEQERAEALSFLSRANLLDQAAADIDALGFVGEETTKRLLYLVAVSRKLDDPLSAIVLSQSGAGKSGITEVIERLTPPEDVVLLTRLTPQSLYYVAPGFLDRKLIIVEERYGSMEADYSIRVLQSRKKLIAAAPVKDPQTGNMRTKVFTVEARAAFIEATTAAAVNHENATRCFELTMDESPEQTRRIHERQRLMRTERGLALRQQADAITRRHWNAQRLLEPLPVVIPYADKLTFPDAWMRTRRDHARFLNLIEVSAFLHQHQRERRADAIVAAPADYQTAYTLAGDVLRETLADVRRPLRAAYEQIRALCGKSDGSVSRREIREALSVPDSTARRWLADLVELEYLEAESGGKGGQGKSARYRLAEGAPREDLVLGLLTPEELRARI